MMRFNLLNCSYAIRMGKRFMTNVELGVIAKMLRVGYQKFWIIDNWYMEFIGM